MEAYRRIATIEKKTVTFYETDTLLITHYKTKSTQVQGSDIKITNARLALTTLTQTRGEVLSAGRYEHMMRL